VVSLPINEQYGLFSNDCQTTVRDGQEVRIGLATLFDSTLEATVDFCRL